MSLQTCTFVIQMMTLSPLRHGGQGDGTNVQPFAMEDVVYHDGIDWVRRKIPHVSGAAFRSTLREHCVMALLEALAIPPGSVPHERLRLYLKGGTMAGKDGGATVSLQNARRLRQLMPVLNLFGAMDGQPMPGRLDVDPVRPWCVSLDLAKLLPRKVLGDAGEVEIWAGVPPVPDDLLLVEQVNFKHDMLLSQAGQVYLEAGQKAALEDKKAAVADKAAPKAERREASESMPYSAKVVPAGVPFYTMVKARDVSEVDLAVLAAGFERWHKDGCHLGAGRSTGQGRMQITIAGRIRYDSRSGERITRGEADMVRVGDGNPYAAALDAHLRENRAEILKELGL